MQVAISRLCIDWVATGHFEHTCVMTIFEENTVYRMDINDRVMDVADGIFLTLITQLFNCYLTWVL